MKLLWGSNVTHMQKSTQGHVHTRREKKGNKGNAGNVGKKKKEMLEICKGRRVISKKRQKVNNRLERGN